MPFRASSMGSGRPIRNSSVCQSNSTASASRRRRSASCGRSSSAATRRSLSRIERRAASVGCAVRTGRTASLPTASATTSAGTPASTIRATARSSQPPPVSRWRSSARPRCTCSVTLARWKYDVNARTTLIVVGRSIALSCSSTAAGSSVKAPTLAWPRTISTRSNSSGPSLRTNVSPSSVVSRRMSARSTSSATG